MMAIMTDGNKEEVPKEFIEGGRTGRRNAMPDILHSDANVTTADLPARLEQLATSGESQDEEMQTKSTTSSSLSVGNASVDSENVLKKFLDSSRSDRRHGIGQIQCLHSKEEATDASLSEDELEEFLKSGCAQRRAALPQIQYNVLYENDKNMRTVGTEVSDTSFKHCCSEERLQAFLNSQCSKRRLAVPCVKVPQPHESIMVDLPTGTQDVSRRKDPKLTRVTEVIQLDQQTLMNMLSDPNNPQPGPSGSAQERSGNDADKKGS